MTCTHISVMPCLHWLNCMTRNRLLTLQHTHSLENNSVYNIPPLKSGQLHFLNACDIGRGYCDILRYVDIFRSAFKSSRESLENFDMLYFPVNV